jgi:hypothetical protein
VKHGGDGMKWINFKALLLAMLLLFIHWLFIVEGKIEVYKPRIIGIFIIDLLFLYILTYTFCMEYERFSKRKQLLLTKENGWKDEHEQYLQLNENRARFKLLSIFYMSIYILIGLLVSYLIK